MRLIFSLILILSTPVMAGGRLINFDDDKFYDALYESYYEAERERQMEDRTPPEDSINKALMEFNYGRDDPTKSEELLQLPSGED